MFEYQRRRGARWLEVASLAFAAAAFSSTPELEAGVLDLGGDTIVSFRELDGSGVDSDGVADGTLTLEAMALSENARVARGEAPKAIRWASSARPTSRGRRVAVTSATM